MTGAPGEERGGATRGRVRLALDVARKCALTVLTAVLGVALWGLLPHSNKLWLPPPVATMAVEAPDGPPVAREGFGSIDVSGFVFNTFYRPLDDCDAMPFEMETQVERSGGGIVIDRAFTPQAGRMTWIEVDSGAPGMQDPLPLAVHTLGATCGIPGQPDEMVHVWMPIPDPGAGETFEPRPIQGGSPAVPEASERVAYIAPGGCQPFSIAMDRADDPDVTQASLVSGLVRDGWVPLAQETVVEADGRATGTLFQKGRRTCMITRKQLGSETYFLTLQDAGG